MAVKLHKIGYDHAVKIINNGLEVEHDANNWDEVKPTNDEIVRYLQTHTLEDYGRWFLAADDQKDAKDRSKYLYPFGDLQVLHKSALLVAQQEAARHKYEEIKRAIDSLLKLIEEKKK